MKKFTAIFLIAIQLLSHFHEAYAVTRLRTAVLSEAETEMEAKTETKTQIDVESILDLGKACLGSFMEVIPPDFCWKKNSGRERPTECPTDKPYVKVGNECVEPCIAEHKLVGKTCYKNCYAFEYEKDNMCHMAGIGNSGRNKEFYSPKVLNFYNRGLACKPGKYRETFYCYNDCTNPSVNSCTGAACKMENCMGVGCASTKAGCNSALASMALEVLFGIVKVVIKITTLGVSGIIKGLKEGVKALGNTSGGQALGSVFDNLKTKFAQTGFAQAVKDSALGKVLEAVQDKAKEGIVTSVCKRIYEAILQKPISKPSWEEVTKSLDVFDLKELKDNCHKPPEANLSAQQKEDRRAACTKAFIETLSNFDPTGLLGTAAAFVQPQCVGI